MNKYQKALWNIIQMLNDNIPTDNYGQDLNILQELVDKTIPKKLAIKYFKNYGYDYLTCPTCFDVKISKDDFDTTIFYKGKYCGECGQALDWNWSEENE